MEDYRPPRAQKSQPHPISEGIAGVEAMIEAAESPAERALVALTGLCALRVSEARSVKCADFDISDLTRVSVTVRGKGDKQRTVPVSARAWEAVQYAFIQAHNSGAYLVPLSDSGARRAFSRIGRKAGLARPVASHDGRATLATAALNGGANIRVVQEILGHASVTTTQVYTGVSNDSMREAVTF